MGRKRKYNFHDMAINETLIIENKTTPTIVSLINHTMKKMGLDYKFSCRNVHGNILVIRIY